MDKIKNISEYIEVINQSISEIKKKNDISKIWFRGEPSSKIKTPLTPKIFRTEDYESAKAVEQHYRAEFKREAITKLKGKLIDINDWNLYFIMQHYGVPTRLLDWTESALISLYFSINSKEYTTDDKVVWVLNPHKWNSEVLKKWSKGRVKSSAIYFPQTDKKNKMFDEDEKLNLDEYLRHYLYQETPNKRMNVEDVKHPYAIYPYYLDDRMRNQTSCFTIHDQNIHNLSEHMVGKDCLRKIIISNEHLKEIKNELKILGITDSLVFPDLEGISKSIQIFE